MNIFKKIRARLTLRLASGFTTLVLVAVIALCLFLTLQSLSVGYVSFFGNSVFRVVTGSMEPEIPVGALLIAQKTDIEDIRERDIVCYRSSNTQLGGIIITHRVVGIYRDPNGDVVLQTKGDANPAADTEAVTDKQLIGRVKTYTGSGSSMAKVIQFLTSDFGFLACILVPVLLIAGFIFRDAVRGMKEAIDATKKQLDEQQTPPESALSEQEYAQLCQQIEEEVRKEMEQHVEEPDDHTAQEFEPCDVVPSPANDGEET